MSKPELHKNLGILPPEEKLTDYIAGTLTGIQFEVKEKDGDWKQYRGENEGQKFAYFDSMGCVSYSGNNSIEAQINRMLTRDELNTDLLKPWLSADGFFNGSDRALAKMPGTTPSGNSQSRVGDTIRHFGIIPQAKWPNKIDGKEFSWAEFYKEIPKDVTDWGLKFLEYFDVQYERLLDARQANLKKHIQHAPIWIAVACCDGWWDTGTVQACSTSPVHAQILDGYEDLKVWYDFDHYDPFSKKLAWNYRFYYPYKLVITPKEAILKKKPINENDMPELVKTPQSSTVYQIGADGLKHPIANEGYVLKMIGPWEVAKPKVVDYIAPDEIGSKIGELSWAAEIINNILGMGNKLGAGIVKKYPKLGSSVDSSNLSLTIKGALLALVPIIIVIARTAGFDLAEGELVSFIEAVTTAIAAGTVAYGLIRKFINTKK